MANTCALWSHVTPWLPLPAEIAKAAYDIDNYKQIMGVIARRLQDKEEDWRHVYKSLLLLEFMAKHGPQKVGLAAYHSCFCCWSWWPILGLRKQHLLHIMNAGAFG